jgi:hypothetical protein
MIGWFWWSQAIARADAGVGQWPAPCRLDALSLEPLLDFLEDLLQ